MALIVIELPEKPKGDEYEEFVSAYLQAGGKYVERRLIDRGKEEILELDIMVTEYDAKLPEIALVEIKSGGWGFTEIFKIRGWLDYLGYPKGVLIVQENKDHLTFFQEKGKNLSVEIILNEDLSQTTENLKTLIGNLPVDERDIETIRFSYWLERNLLKLLKNKKKSVQDKQSFKDLDDYYFQISSRAFFTDGIVNRIKYLYRAFSTYPRISAKLANELAGNSYEDGNQNIPTSIYNETFYKCKFNDLQVSLHIEHLARLTILKNCVDYILNKEAGRIEEKGWFDRIEFALLPNSVKDTLKSISQDNYFHKYPIFWQWFIYVFGGFIMLDYEEREYELLAEKTGIPIDEIPKAFAAYERLFPLPTGSWFYQVGNSNLRMMKLFPTSFSGNGANYRRVMYAPNQTFEELKPNLTKEHTYNNLIKWNNLLVEILDKKIK